MVPWAAQRRATVSGELACRKGLPVKDLRISGGPRFFKRRATSRERCARIDGSGNTEQGTGSRGHGTIGHGEMGMIDFGLGGAFQHLLLWLSALRRRPLDMYTRDHYSRVCGPKAMGSWPDSAEKRQLSATLLAARS